MFDRQQRDVLQLTVQLVWFQPQQHAAMAAPTELYERAEDQQLSKVELRCHRNGSSRILCFELATDAAAIMKQAVASKTGRSG